MHQVLNIHPASASSLGSGTVRRHARGGSCTRLQWCTQSRPACSAQELSEGTLEAAPAPVHKQYTRPRPARSAQELSEGVPELVGGSDWPAASALLATLSALVTSGWPQSCGCSSGSTQLLCGVGGTLQCTRSTSPSQQLLHMLWNWLVLTIADTLRCEPWTGAPSTVPTK